MDFFPEIPVARVTGLRPAVWLCVGPGYSREDVKARLLQAGNGLVGESLFNSASLALRFAGVRPERVLASSASRQEVLRVLMSESRILARLPELARLRRQGGFFRRLDRAMQAGRMAAAHSDEEAVLASRLEEHADAGETSVLRLEVRMLHAAYEQWLEGEAFFDPPAVLRRACEALTERPVVRLPEEIVVLTAQTPESLEKQFWDALSRHVPVRFAGLAAPGEQSSPGSGPSRAPIWERWHTFDDAAESLAERIAAEKSDAAAAGRLGRHAVLIPDLPAIRRALQRAFNDRGVPLSDPRDPTRLRWDEGVKSATLPLELVARDFERRAVVSWLRFFPQQDPALVAEIHARGIRSGLVHYAGGKLAGLHAVLSDLQTRLGGKKTCKELSEAHLALLRDWTSSGLLAGDWIAFFEALWAAFLEDVTRVGLAQRRAKPLYWIDRFEARIDEASPPVARLKPRDGVLLYRLGQAPVAAAGKVWILGLPPGWLGDGKLGDYWYSERDREVLSAEFSVRSAIQVRQERTRCLQAWLGGAEEGPVLLDAQYEWDGRERESLLPLLRELGFEGVAPVDRGSHPRWTPSYDAIRPTAAVRFRLPPVPAGADLTKPEIHATTLERYSRCPFTALAGSRWKVRDGREPEPELWSNVRGDLLHAAVKILVEARDADGNFARTPEDALDEAWRSVRPQGLLRGQRLRDYARSSLLVVLRTFCEKERDYVRRARTEVLSLEGPEVRLEFEQFHLKGRPDRVDGHSEGLFVLDYKTSSVLPKGNEMLDGYRLQLPFYAIGAAEVLKRPAIGVQFVELNRKGGRGNGIFLKRHNGKDPGKLTNSRSKNSVLDMSPEDIWARCLEHIEATGNGYCSGDFSVSPRKETECRGCPYADLCGRRRLGPATEEAEDGND